MNPDNDFIIDMTHKFLKSSLLIAFLAVPLAGLAQNGVLAPSDERSAFEERRKSILDANNMRATYHNYGFAGRASGQDELVYEYPKNTNRWYIYFMSIFTGTEVQNQVDLGQKRFLL